MRQPRAMPSNNAVVETPTWYVAEASRSRVLPEVDSSTRAGIVLPALSYGEIEGTFTNFMGRVQRVRAGLAPGADGLPLYRIAQEIGRRLGAHAGRAGAQETFTALAAEVPVYGGLTYARLGELGAPQLTYGLSLTRYNRVEGFSTGLRAEELLGGGYSADLLARLEKKTTFHPA